MLHKSYTPRIKRLKLLISSGHITVTTIRLQIISVKVIGSTQHTLITQQNPVNFYEIYILDVHSLSSPTYVELTCSGYFVAQLTNSGVPNINMWYYAIVLFDTRLLLAWYEEVTSKIPKTSWQVTTVRFTKINRQELRSWSLFSLLFCYYIVNCSCFL